jgi:GH24 family phage-related lysozyme (muramidase)
LLRLLNAGQPAAIIVKHFMLWDKVSTPDGLTVSDGLLARRRAEADIFLNGNYVNHS